MTGRGTCDCSCHDLSIPAGCGNCDCLERTGPCFHQRTSRGRVYEGCLDCGAVRVLEQAGVRGEWHSCERCYYGPPATPHPAHVHASGPGHVTGLDCEPKR
jgi:hypothetical protein